LPVLKRPPTDTVTVLEFGCDCCKKGVFRATGVESVGPSLRTWLHQCTYCGEKAYFTGIYPMLEYIGKKFMLMDKANRSNNGPLPSLHSYKPCRIEQD